MATVTWVNGANRVTLTGLEDADGAVTDATVTATVTPRGEAALTPVSLAHTTGGTYTAVVAALAKPAGTRISIAVAATSGTTTRTWTVDAVIA